MNRSGSSGQNSPGWPSVLLVASMIGPAAPARTEADELSNPATPPPAVQVVGTPGETSTVSSFIERYAGRAGRGSSTIPTTPDRPLPHVDPVRPDPPPAPATAPRPIGGPPRPGEADPLATDMRLSPAPFDPRDRRFPINLATVLRLSDARPLVVAAAQASVWVAEAELTRTKVLWLPSLTFGVDYIRHDGGGPDFNKGILTAPSVNYFYAGPSLFQYLNVTDAVYEPLAARQVLDSRHWDVQSAKNDALLQTADAYFQVHQWRGVYAGTLYAVDRGRELRRRLESLSGELVPRVEVDRVKNLLADLEQRSASARREWRARSADLTQVLRLDPRAVVEPLESDHTQITMIDPACPLEDLLPVALANRPELASRKALVRAAEYRVRREKARPLLPLVMLNGFQTSGGMMIQGGIFGLGPNNKLNQWDGRDDVSVQLMWQLDGFGIGNLARIKAQRGRQSRSIVDLRETQDMVAGDVARVLARVQSAATRLLQADRALRTGIIAFNGQLEGLGQTKRFGDVLALIYRPQELIYSLKLMNTAFDEYFTTVSEYNRAQFELFHALGYPARELAVLRSPGAVVPVDTSRPEYLPPVGNGPPPATR